MNQEDHNLLKAFDKFPAPANALAISADGKRLAIAGESSEAWVFDIELGARLSKAAGLGPSAFAAAFSPDGAQVAFGGHDGTLRIFNAETGALVREMVPVPLNAARAPRAPSHPRPR
jgi:WD40 repeat protein